MPESKASRIRDILLGLSDSSSWPVIRYLSAKAFARFLGRRATHEDFAFGNNITLCQHEPTIRQLPLQTGQTDEVPKIIFQTWKSRVEIPSNYRYWRKTFIKNNPDFQHLLWDDADNRQFIIDEFPWFLPVYQRYPAEIFRVDAVRPFFLLRYGGLYADMDTECLRPLTTMATSADVVLGQMGSDPSFEHSIPNAIMASKSFELFWALVIAMMISKADRLGSVAAMRQHGPEVCTGPILLKEAYEFYQSETEVRVRAKAEPVVRQLSESLRTRLHAGKVALLAPDLWYPINWNNWFHQKLRSQLLRERIVLEPDEARALFPNAFLVTYWSQSWV